MKAERCFEVFTGKWLTVDQFAKELSGNYVADKGTIGFTRYRWLFRRLSHQSKAFQDAVIQAVQSRTWVRVAANVRPYLGQAPV